MSGAQPIVLIGLPGAGKSTVGKALAADLGLPFRDTDSDIEQTAGTTIADLFLTHGEMHFRVLERAAVAAALAEHDGVLALGGGAVLDPDTQADLAHRTVVLLRVTLTSAAPRVGLTTARPLLVGSPRKQWLQLAADREPIYASLATIAVDTDKIPPREVARVVRKKLGR